MVEQFEAKVEKKFLSIDEKLADLDKEVGLVSDDGKKESKEKQEKLELEKENYKISSLSQDQKDKMKIGEIVDGWTKEKAKAEINGEKKEIIVLKKDLGGGAYVWEYQKDGVIPEYLVGEQLFNRYAVQNLGLEKQLPSREQMDAMRGGAVCLKDASQKNNCQTFLEEHLQKDGKNLFPGCWVPEGENFVKINEDMTCWLTDMGYLIFHVRRRDGWKGGGKNVDKDYKNGYSLRLLKQK